MTDVSDTLDPNGVYIRVQQWVIVGTTIVVPLLLMVMLLVLPLLWGTTKEEKLSPAELAAAADAELAGLGGGLGGSEKAKKRPSASAPVGPSATASDASTARSPSVALPPLDPADHLGLAFERVALAQPSKVAVQSIDGTTISFTYGALLASARALAGKLSQAGLAKSNGLVGLAIARSAEGATGILGIVLAGGAYVPLDPSYPEQRLAQIIESARLELAATLPGSDIANWLRDEWPNVATVDVAMLRAGATLSPSDAAVRTLLKDLASTRPAYVLFTSGSTGTPKGVPGYHHAVIKRVSSWHAAFPYDREEATLNHITYTWVDHVMEVWNALLGGRSLIIVPDPQALMQCVDEPPPSVRRILLVPSLLRAMLDRGEAIGKVPTGLLSLVTVSGEPMPATLLGRYRDLVPNGTLVNVYGMTEGHGDCTAAVYGPSRAFNPANDRVSIGRGIIDFTLCVRDVESGRWVREPGESGELYLASSCVVSGYYKHSDGTVIADEKARTKFPAVTPALGLKEASVPLGAVLFQTGDLVKWRADGELDHLGRVDDQVKVNGVRTELGDISAAAMRCNKVKTALAVAAKDKQNETRVVVFVTPKMSDKELMSELSTYLPPVYMPAMCVTMSDLPKLRNGKSDRKKLEGLAEVALGKAPPTDSIGRLFTGKLSDEHDRWQYICLHMSFLAILGMIFFHVTNFAYYFSVTNTEGQHDWLNFHGLVAPNLFHATSLAFFASGFADVLMPPKSCGDVMKSILLPLVFYIAWQPVATYIGIESFANIWPVGLLVLVRALFLPLLLLMRTKWKAPAWVELLLLGSIALASNFVCLPFRSFGVPSSGSDLVCAPSMVLNKIASCAYGKSADHLAWCPRVVRGMAADAYYVLNQNQGISVLPAYALYPRLVAFFWPNAWKPPPRSNDFDGSIGSVLKRIIEPSFYCPLLGLAYLVGYHIIINVDGGVYSDAKIKIIQTRWFLFAFVPMQLGMFVSLFYLLPARATPLSGLGHSALTAYIAYMGFFEPVALVRMGESLRFINSPYHPIIEYSEVVLLSLVFYVAGSVSFGLTEPISVPRLSRFLACFGFPKAIQLPTLIFPCGGTATALAWLVFMAIPNGLSMPHLPPGFGQIKPEQSRAEEEETRAWALMAHVLSRRP